MLSELERTINGRRRIYLLRHGEVSYFDGDGQPFRPDEVSLNGEGLAQAEAAARALEPLEIDRLIASGLARTMETAAALARSGRLAIEVREELREIAPGRLAELPREGFESLFLRALGGELTRASRFLGGESFGALEDRVLPCFRTLLEESGWKRLAIVAHGGVNRLLIAHALGAGLAAIGRLEQDAGAINIIDVDPDGSLMVRLVNYSPSAPLKEGLHLTTMEKIFLDHRSPGARRGLAQRRAAGAGEP
jgi:broad specificity phosphatase PhoE